MSPPLTRAIDSPVLTPVIAGLTGLAVSLIGITGPSVWIDESATITSARRSWGQLWLEAGHLDAVHTFYYAIMHVIFDVFGYSVLSLRVPSAIGVGLAAALTTILGRKIGGNWLGFIAGIVFCFLPRITWAGTEGRSYAMTALATVALTLVFIGARRREGRIGRLWWVAYSLTALLACLLFVFTVFVVLAHGITLALHAVSKNPTDRPRRSIWVGWVASSAAAGILLLPFLSLASHQSSQVYWIPRIASSTIPVVVVSQWFDNDARFADLAWAFMIIGAGMLVFTHGWRPFGSIVLPIVALPTIGILAVSILKTPVYSARYLTLCTPFVALLIAAALLWTPWRWLTAVGLAALIALSVPSIVAQRAELAKEFAPWDRVSSTIAHDRALAGRDATTAMIWGAAQQHHGVSTEAIEWAYPSAFTGTIDVTLVESGAQRGGLWGLRQPLAASVSRLAHARLAYLVTSPQYDERSSTATVMAAAGWHASRRWTFPGAIVVRYSRG